MNAIIEADGLTKFYGEKDVVFDLDLSVERGTMFGFLGPNGAGKTTTVNMLCTLLKPTAGQARVAGFDVARDPYEVRRRISVVFQDSTLDPDLNCVENLRFQSELFGVPKGKREALIEEKLELVGLTEHTSVNAVFLSGGMRRRLEIARGLLHEPELIFLDEPTTGLDPQTRAAIWEHLRDLVKDRGTTVFLTTHHLEEAENCHNIAIIDSGKVVVEGSPDSLKAAFGSEIVRLHTDDDPGAKDLIERELGVSCEIDDVGIRFEVADAGKALFQVYHLEDVHVSSVTVTRPTLDDVFLRHTGHAIRDREYSNLVTDMVGRSY